MTVVAPGQQKKLELRGSSVATWISPRFFPVFPREEEEEATVITDWSQSLKTDRKKGSLL